MDRILYVVYFSIIYIWLGASIEFKDLSDTILFHCWICLLKGVAWESVVSIRITKKLNQKIFYILGSVYYFGLLCDEGISSYQMQSIFPLCTAFLDAVKVTSEREGKQTVKSDERKAEVVEIDASLERNVVDLLCNTLLNLPVSCEDIKDALYKVILNSA